MPDDEPTPTDGRRVRGRSASRRQPPPAAIRLADLPSAERRRAILLCAATVAFSWVFIVGAFFALPIGHESGLRAVVRLAVDIALVGAVVLWQFQRITRAMLPELRAIEALGIIVAVFLIGFSAIYLAMSHQSGSNFSQSLDHVQALYFTITVFSTVGFGDITPQTDPARLVVSAQMLLDLVIIGALVRMIFTTARNRVTSERRTDA